MLLPEAREGSLAGPVLNLADSVGVVLDPWQRWFTEEAMQTDKDGYWSAFEVACFVARQNGKGEILIPRQIAGLFLLDERLQVYSAHEFKTAVEHWLKLLSVVENNDELMERVKSIRRGSGEQSIEVHNRECRNSGQRICPCPGYRLKVLARSGGSGRGFTGDIVYLDEAYALSTAEMGALMPTMSARPNPQIWYMSSAAKFTSEVMHQVIDRGRAGDDTTLFYADWGLDAGVDLGDPENWARSNPAFGIRISEAFIDGEYQAMRSMPEEFARERLGVHEGLKGDVGKIRISDWDALEDARSEPVENGHLCFAVDVSPEGRWASVAVAGRRGDGLGHVEVVERREGTGWVADFVQEVFAANRVPFRIDPASPAGGLIAVLEERGVEVVQVSMREHAHACQSLYDSVVNREVFHRVDPMLRAAVVGAKERVVGDLWLWSRSHSAVDITPLVAVTLAWGGVPVGKVSKVAEAHFVLG